MAVVEANMNALATGSCIEEHDFIFLGGKCPRFDYQVLYQLHLYTSRLALAVASMGAAGGTSKATDE